MRPLLRCGAKNPSNLAKPRIAPRTVQYATSNAQPSVAQTFLELRCRRASAPLRLRPQGCLAFELVNLDCDWPLCAADSACKDLSLLGIWACKHCQL